MDETAQQRTERLAARWPGHAPFRAEASGASPGNAPTLYRGVGAVALFARPARLHAEHAGAARAEPHPALPRVLDCADDVELLEPFGGPAPDAIEAVRGWPWRAPVASAERRRDVLRELSADLRLDRAARSLEVPRRHVDRWLDAEVELATPRGVDFGGLPAALHRSREGDGPPLVLRRDRARPQGWLALELAALGADAAVHRSAAGSAGPARADEAFAIARFAVRLREATHRRDSAALAALARTLRPTPEPSSVRVWIEAPPCVAADAWESPGAVVSASRARWLLRELDGMAVGGGLVAVRTEPPLRKGRRPPKREARAERDRRLFSRFAHGIRLDEEARYSVTPEALARRLAKRARGVVLDATCGAGGLTIAFASEPGVDKVIAVDRHPARLEMARHNAAVYGLEDRCEFVLGEARDVLREARADLLVVDPPWGGPAYDRAHVALADLPMDVAGLLRGHSGATLLKLPRSFDPSTLPGEGWALEAIVDSRGALKFLAARRG